MNFFYDNCFKKAESNTYYRDTIFTTDHSQLVLMSLKPGETIPREKHNGDQIFIIVAGEGEASIDQKTVALKEHGTLIVPANVEHEIRNTSNTPLKFFTVYTPPQHPAETRHETAADDEEHA